MEDEERMDSMEAESRQPEETSRPVAPFEPPKHEPQASLPQAAPHLMREDVNMTED